MVRHVHTCICICTKHPVLYGLGWIPELGNWTDLKHKHGQFLVVLPLLRGRLHVSGSGRERRAAALTGKLSVKLGHFLKLLPQVLSDDLGPFCSKDGTKTKNAFQQHRDAAVKKIMSTSNKPNPNPSNQITQNTNVTEANWKTLVLQTQNLIR